MKIASLVQLNIEPCIQRLDNRIMTSAEWKRPALEVLLKLYREHPVLYDMRHPKYYNKTDRQKALNTIIDLLEDHRPGTTSNEILRKIQSMRTQFGQELSKIKRQQSKGVSYAPTVWWYNYLSFLRIHIRPRSAIDDEYKLTDSQRSEADYENYNDESYDYDESEIVYEIQSPLKVKGNKAELINDSKLQNGNDKDEIIYEITEANTVIPKRKHDLTLTEEQSAKHLRSEATFDGTSVQSNSGGECSAGRKSEICEIAVEDDRCHSLGKFVASQMAAIKDDYLFYATQMDVLNVINKAQLNQLVIDKEERKAN